MSDQLTGDVKRVPIDSIEPHPDNARKGDVNGIARSIERFGQVPGSIAVQRSTNYIVKGNHTWKAIKQLGWDYVDVIFVDMDDVTARAYLIADNATSDRAVYEKGKFVQLLGKTLSNLEGTGFTEDDFEALSEEIGGEKGPEKKYHRTPTDVEGREVDDAPEPTREIPLRIKSSEIETFAKEVHDLQAFWKLETLPEVVQRSVAEAHDRWKAGVGQVGMMGSSHALPEELKAGADF